MPGYILLISAVILICVSLNKVSSKLGMPMLLAFILLGMLLGSDGLVKIPFDNYVVAEQICSISLIFIMFYGGFGTNWKQAKPVAVKAMLLSTIGVVLTAGITGIFCFLVVGFDLLESLLIGSVISSTDAASVFSILRSKRLNLKDHTASMLEVESGSNDPCSYMLTVMILSIIRDSSGGEQLLYMIFSQVVYGVLLGVAVSWICTVVLAKFKFAGDGFDTIFVVGMALVAYGAASLIGGNGYLSVYIAGIILGNQPIPNKKALVHFFDVMTGLVQMLIFCLLGLVSFPSSLPHVALSALGIVLFLTFVARPIAVFLILSPLKCPLNQRLLVSWAGLRGAASIVFAMMAIVSGVNLKNDLFHIVFFIVLFSIGVQGCLIARMAKKLDMIDDSHNVMKTFSDYSDEIPIQFIKLTITKGHAWINKKIREIELTPGLLLVLILRGNERMIPKGATTILEGDTIMLSALSLEEDMGVALSEVRIEKDHIWLGKSLSEIRLSEEKLVIGIKRHQKVVIPNGKTVLKEDDLLIISELGPTIFNSMN